MGILDILKKIGDEAYTDNRGRKVSYGQMMSTGYKYQVITDKLTERDFNEGKYIGKKEGYVEASNEYEKKLLKQANEFLKQKEIATTQKVKYDKLLDEYEKYIDELESKVNLSEKEKEYLNQLLLTERKLRKLK